MTNVQARGLGRVLLVMEPPLASLVTLALSHGRFTVRDVKGVEQARPLLSTWQPHLMIVDLDHDGKGMELVGIARDGGGGTVPVITVTQRGDVRSKLEVFERGGDDFVTIPFSPEELVARALAVMRRTYGPATAFLPIIRVDELEIDIANRRVKVGSEQLVLTSTEQALLYLLAANAGRLVSRETILDTLWGADYLAESNVVDRHVRNLREKLRDDWREPRYIETVAGKGYRYLRTSGKPKPDGRR